MGSRHLTLTPETARCCGSQSWYHRPGVPAGVLTVRDQPGVQKETESQNNKQKAYFQYDGLAGKDTYMEWMGEESIKEGKTSSLEPVHTLMCSSGSQEPERGVGAHPGSREEATVLLAGDL